MDERRLQQLVRGFAGDWKKSIEVLNQDIMQSFTNFKNGTAILQVLWYRPYMIQSYICIIFIATSLQSSLNIIIIIGSSGAVDSVLPSIPKGSLSTALQEPADSRRVDQHPSSHG